MGAQPVAVVKSFHIDDLFPADYLGQRNVAVSSLAQTDEASALASQNQIQGQIAEGQVRSKGDSEPVKGRFYFEGAGIENFVDPDEPWVLLAERFLEGDLLIIPKQGVFRKL